MHKFRKIWIFFSIVFFISWTFLFILKTASAHPGNTDSSGCHTCRTNCPSWGLSYGEYHCHNPKSYSLPSVSSPSCPFFSTYDSFSGSCKCMTGYVVGTDLFGKESCVSGDSKCRERYGLWSRYDSVDKICKCSSGYIMGTDSLGKQSCVSMDSQCKKQLGSNSRYNSSKDTCECAYDYVISGEKCVSKDDYCQDLFGYGSKNNSLTDKCECKLGYSFNGIKCEYEVGNNAASSYSNSYNNETYTSCPENSFKSSDGKCNCNIGYVANFLKDGCIKKECPFFSKLVGDYCVCNSGYFWDSEKALCIENKKCGDNQVSLNNECYCSVGYSFNTDKTACVVNVKYLTVSTNINLRERASANSKIIGQLKKGIKYQITDSSNKDWIKVKFEINKEGYALKRLVNIK